MKILKISWLEWQSFGNVVDKAFRIVIWFYWMNYIFLPKVDAFLLSWTLTLR
jgi:hypothetical protein